VDSVRLGRRWIVGTAIFHARVRLLATAFQTQRGWDNYIKWAEVFAGIAYPIFVVAFGAYVILWLRTRQRL
jgi:hypothetical protein